MKKLQDLLKSISKSLVTLKEKTGFDSRQLSNALYKLSKRGMIVSIDFQINNFTALSVVDV